MLESEFADNIYYPFDNYQQYKLAKAMTNPRVTSRRLIEAVCVKAEFLAEGVAFRSIDDFFSHLDIMRKAYVAWRCAQICPTNGIQNPWSNPSYWKKDSLAVLQEILENTALADKCVWAPVREFNEDGERIFTDMHTGDWWWDMQVSVYSHCANISRKLVMANLVEH